MLRMLIVTLFWASDAWGDSVVLCGQRHCIVKGTELREGDFASVMDTRAQRIAFGQVVKAKSGLKVLRFETVERELVAGYPVVLDKRNTEKSPSK